MYVTLLLFSAYYVVRGFREIFMITNSKVNFSFGNCAAVAIAGAFELPLWFVNEQFRARGILDPATDGVTFNDCQSVIYGLGRRSGRKVVHRKLHYLINYNGISKIMMDGTYIVHFDEHLSLLQDGVVYDDYFIDNPIRFKQWVPCGWWVIK